MMLESLALLALDPAAIAYNFANGWGPIALIALAVSFITTALSFMFSDVLNSPELKAWAKNELNEALISGFLVISLLTLLTISSSLIQGMTGSNDHFALGREYLEFMHTRLRTLYYSMLWKDFYIGIISSMGMSVPVPEPGILNIGMQLQPLLGLMQINNALTLLLDSVAVMEVSIVAQQAILDFVRDYALLVFLPIGLTLRAFVLTRKVGSTLIAVAVAMALVYPLALYLNLQIIENTSMAPHQVNPYFYNESYKKGSVLTDTQKGVFGGLNLELSQSDSILKPSDSCPDGTSPVSTSDSIAGLRSCFVKQVVEYDPYNKNSGVNCDPSFYSCKLAAAYSNAKMFMKNIYVKSVTFFKTMYTFISNFMFFSPADYANMAYASLMTDLDPVMQLMVAAVLLPFLDIIIVVTFFRSISLTLGGEAQLFGMQKYV
ncbi:Uncharacterised protein [Candidatus Gugararchaeum adminiculabundum]|nr:Uncharacterised protein [Candidatus Gugararchaeum adminiculabundum]